jgi:hypothetical protein
MSRTGPPPPPLSAQDRAAAAARGVRARQLRAGLRAGLADGSLRIDEVLARGAGDDEDGRVIARMRVVDLVSSFRGIGPVRAAGIMQDIGIAANRRVGGLGQRQVDALIDVIGRRQGGGHA